jgi:hypothetical protein
MIESALEVPANFLEGVLMGHLWGVCVSHTLVGGKGNIRMAVFKIQ